MLAIVAEDDELDLFALHAIEKLAGAGIRSPSLPSLARLCVAS